MSRITVRLDSVENWKELSALMAKHPDWTVDKCKRHIMGIKSWYDED